MDDFPAVWNYGKLSAKVLVSRVEVIDTVGFLTFSKSFTQTTIKIPLNPILPEFYGHSEPGTTPCNSFIWPSLNLKLVTSIGMSKNYSHTKTCWAIFLNDVTMTSFPIFFNFFVSCLILRKFSTEMLLAITNKSTKFCWDWLRNDVTVTSSLILRIRFGISTFKRMCLHGNM